MRDVKVVLKYLTKIRLLDWELISKKLVKVYHVIKDYSATSCGDFEPKINHDCITTAL